MTRTFAPEPVSAREARRFLRGFLAVRRRDDLTDAAELALSELVTNAVLHAHTAFEVTAELAQDGALRVEVADRSSQLPDQRDYGAQATTGRGMQLVAALTAACGVQTDGSGGKAVWFVVRSDARHLDDREGRHGSWGATVHESSAPDESSPVVLLGLPPTLWLAAREHHDAVLRELALHAQRRPGDVPPAERFARADTVRGLVSGHVAVEVERRADNLAAAHRALPAGHPSPLPDTPPALDLHLRIPSGAGESYAALQDLLDAAERLAVAGQLLARPGLPEIVAVRDWVCEQIIAQLAGVPPSPWAGTSQERFTVEARGRAVPAVPDWDTTEVTASNRGVIAGHDANRIIAVSRPLAELLGWDADDLVGRRVVALIPPELREAHVAGFTRHLTTGQSNALGVPLRLPVLRADGSRIDCQFLIEQGGTGSARRVYVAWIDPVDGGPAPRPEQP